MSKHFIVLFILLMVLIGAAGSLTLVFLDLSLYGSPSYITEPIKWVARTELVLFASVTVTAIIAVIMLVRTLLIGGGKCYLCGGSLHKR